MKSTRKNRGFTFFELMAAVGSLSVVMSVAYVGITEMKASIKAQKLEQDVSVINTALQMYVAHGGRIGTLTSPQSIIDKLKTVPTTENRKQIAGLRDSMVDPRLEVVMQSVKDAETGDPRALWNSAQKRFVVVREGDPGIKSFRMNKARIVSAPVFDDDRVVSLKLAKNSNWVWDYVDTDNGNPNSFGPVNVGSTSSVPFGLPNTPPGPLALNPPSFSPEGGNYPLLDFESFPVTLSDPNPPGSSQLIYSLDGSNWSLYQGETFLMDPDDTIQAIAVTLDPDAWADSGIFNATYTAIPVQLGIGVSIPQNPLSYPQAGGTMIPGGAGVASPVGPISVSLTNSADVPNRYQNSDDFNVVWSYDGTDPLTALAPNSGGTFSNGFPGVSIDYSLPVWGARDSLQLNVAAKSNNTGVLASSEVSSTEITIDKIALRLPTSNLDDEAAYTADQKVSFTPVSAFGDLPQGWRIYYTTDGTDPGFGNDGEPVNGSIYTGEFDLFAGASNTADIAARVYGPSGHAHWFTPSPLFSANFTRWNVPIWDGFVGGDFSSREYSSFRNIKQHLTDGALDLSFNPGSGLNERGRAIVFQPDGKAIVAGEFTTVDGYSRGRIVRFNTDGSVDTSFDPGSGFDREVLALRLQPDGKILVGGKFQRFDGISRKGLARLNSDGSLDWSFNVGQGVHSDDDGWVHAIDLQYPPTSSSDPGDNEDSGLLGGHFDLDTSSFIAAVGSGSTDGHVHEYDDKHNVVGADFFNLLDSKLHNISEDISDPNQKFKIIVANADLSPGGRVVINDTYNSDSGASYTPVKDYDNTDLASLPIYSLGGAPGSTKLEQLGMYFHIDSINLGGLVPTNTGDVKKNEPGLNGEWRNGALTIQAVAVNPDGSDAFTTSTGLSAGGNQGVATSGLLWEATLFWHWDGDSYHENPGYVPGDGGNPGGGGAPAPEPPCLIVLDAEAIDTDISSIQSAASSHGVSTEWLINENQTTENGNPWFKWSLHHAGDEVLLPAGQSGDEGWFSLPASLPWSVSAFANGTISQSNLDKIRDVNPLNPTELTDLIGKKVVAVVYKSDVSMNYGPTEANLQGERRGRLAFTVLGLQGGPDYGYVRVRIESPINTVNDACQCGATELEGPWPKVIIGGCFSRYNYNSAKSLARVELDGSFDASFDTSKGVSGYLHDVEVEPSGKILIAGSFSKYDGKGRKNINRVDVDGKNDSSFKNTKGADKEVYVVKRFDDGKIFIGGLFNSVDKKQRKGVARLKSDGKVDSGWNIGTGSGVPSWRIYAADITSDGKVIVGGNLQAYNPTSRSAFKRLNTNGTIDNTYTPEDLPQNSTVWAIAARNDDRALITGSFPEQSVSFGDHVARLNTADGSVDDSFDIGEGADSPVNAVLKLSDGDLLVGGTFDEMKGSNRDRLAKLGPDGSLRPLSISVGGGDIHALAEDADGKILVGGSFTSIAGSATYARIARLNADGSLDTSFLPPGTTTTVWVQTHPWKWWKGYWSTQSTHGFNGTVHSIDVLEDGRILVGGAFTEYGGVSQVALALLESDGSPNALVSAANGNIPGSGAVYDAMIHPNGKIYYSGSFAGHMACLNADFTSDADFSLSANGAVRSVALMENGRILIGGEFTSVEGSTRGCVASIERDGDLDTAFDTAAGANGTVRQVVALTGGRCILMGDFSNFAGAPRNGTVCLTVNGAIDEAFGNSTLDVNTINSTD